MSLDYIASLLEKEKASIIFPPMPKGEKKRAQANSFAYEPAPLENLLMSCFGQHMLSDTTNPTMVMTQSKKTGESVCFNSWDLRTKDIYEAGAARGTTAASSYFPPSTQPYDGELQEFVDGGIVANNPAPNALEEVLKLRERDNSVPLRKINVLSIGTGAVRTRNTFGQSNPGVVGVIDDMEGAMRESVKVAHERVIEKLITQKLWGGEEFEVTYYRLNPELDQIIELDDSSDENIGKLRTAVFEKIFQSQYYQELINHLRDGDNDFTKNRSVQISGVDIDGKNQDKIVDLTKKYDPLGGQNMPIDVGNNASSSISLL